MTALVRMLTMSIRALAGPSVFMDDRPTGDMSHQAGRRLPLHSARRMVTFLATELHHHLVQFQGHM